MKLFIAAGAFALALLAAGCASTTPPAGSAASSNPIASAINSITGALTSPQAAQAFANLQAGSAAVTCFVANADQAVANANALIKSKAQVAIARDANNVYVASSAACTALGGKTTGTAIVPAGAAPAPAPAAAPAPAPAAPSGS